MKKLSFLLLGIFLLSMPQLLMSQFAKTHYYSGNTSMNTDFIKGGVAVDTNNNKWFGTDQGVLMFNGTTWTSYTMANGLPSDIISCIDVDKNNNVWIGTEGDGVARFNGSSWTIFTVHSTNNGTDSLCDNGIYDISSDLNGHVWFASKGNGVSEYDGNIWKTYKSGLPSDGGTIAGINFIKVDDANSKWFGTDMGLAKFDGSNWTIINIANMDSLIDNKITSIAIDDANNKWLGTWLGITKINASNSWVKNYRMVDGLYTHAVADLDFDDFGNLWMGLYTDYNNDGGITKFTGSSWISEQINFPDSVSGDQIFKIAIDKNNDIWVAMDYGVIKIDHTSGIRFLNPEKTLDIYPNPASDHVYISLPDRINFSGIVEIYSNVNKVASYTIKYNSGPFRLSLENFKDGLYLIKIGNYSGKLMVTRK